MTHHRDALAFLVRRTAANRMARQLARLKQPRYAFAFVAGALYAAFILFGPSGPSTPGTGVYGLGSAAGVGIAIAVIAWWLGRGASLGLAFRPAEVQLLFPAPLSRRALLAYKLVRSQLPIVVSAIVSALLVGRWGVALALPARIAATWGLFTVLSLHRLAVALVRTQPVHGLRRAVRDLGTGLAAAAAVALAAGVGPALSKVGDAGLLGTVQAVTRALAVPPASYAMAPFRLIIAPVVAPTTEAWMRAFAVVSGIVALHVAWVLAMHVEFEEEAAVASEALARRRAALQGRRAARSAVGKVKVVRDWLPLSPRGHPAVAIAWKNTIALARTGSLRSMLLFVATITIVSRFAAAAAPRRSGAALVTPYVGIAAMMLVVGPRMLRNDLRQDLLSVSLLKTYPLRGLEVVAAELVSPTLVLAAFQLAMLTLAYVSLPPDSRLTLGAVDTVTVAILSPLAIIAVNAVGVAIHNALALYFPAWVRLGADSGGVEATGQGILLVLGSMLAFVVLLAIPVTIGLVTLVLGRTLMGGAAMAAAGLATIAALGGELALLVAALGREFERTEPAAIE